MNRLTERMITEFAESIKVGLVASIDDDNLPHITVLSTLMGKDDDKMMFGKFCEGLSKEHLLKRPQAGFLIMNPNKEFWYGKMTFTHTKKEGDDYVLFNNQPLYRYNTYFGINTVYYFDLLEISEGESLPMKDIIMSSIMVMLTKGKYKDKDTIQVMKPWAVKFTSKLDTLLFVSYIGDDGYPVIIPTIQGQSAGSSRILIKNKPYTDKLNQLKKDQDIAILAFSMSMETVLLKGKFSGFNEKGYGYLDINRVYNSMPPVHKYIYPEIVD
ncbi:MAG: hypothetical protein WC251_03865 [Candidatus Izemoplasmatales bacterium]